MLKKMIGLFLCLVLLLLPIVGVNAEDNESYKTYSTDTNYVTYNNAIVPLSAYTKSTYTNLAIVSGSATCVASLTGYPGITTKVEITMYLEKKQFLFFWFTDASWSETFYSYNAAMSKQWSVSGGTYRVKAVYVAYSGTESETITGYSSTVTY